MRRCILNRWFPFSQLESTIVICSATPSVNARKTRRRGRIWRKAFEQRRGMPVDTAVRLSTWAQQVRRLGAMLGFVSAKVAGAKDLTSCLTFITACEIFGLKPLSFLPFFQ